MKMSLAAWLALSYLAVILIGMSIAAPLAWLAVERLYLNTQQDNLLAQAQVAAAALGSQAPPAAESLPYSQASNALPGIHTRVIDSQGSVVINLSGIGTAGANDGLELPQLAQNASGLVTSGELLARPEIAQALEGQPATAVRSVEAANGRRVLYAAAPVFSEDGSITQIVYLAAPLPDTQWAALPAALRQQFTAQIAAVILLASLTAGAAGLLLARRISCPLERLASAAHAVAAGDLEQKTPEEAGISELAQLGGAFNRMTGSLRQADQVKTAFISDVTHELRTPLTVIKGTIETLQDGALDDLEARGPFLASMSRETERLIRLVNDLLVLTRADAGALNLQPGPLDLAELARSRLQHFARYASQRQVHLEIIPAPQPVGQVFADADRLAQVLDNLLDNAIRYSPVGGTVTVVITQEMDQITCRVCDEGPGIPPEHLPLIFERFYRVDPSRERRPASGWPDSSGPLAGSGLGLAIVSGLVQAHGGRVSAESSQGKGTTIAFWLPQMPP